MSDAFPGPSTPIGSRAEVFLTYLDYFRAKLVDKCTQLPPTELRHSRLASGWTPVELLNHLRHVERRWLEWGFEAQPISDPWADSRNDRWYVAPTTTLEELVTALQEQGGRTRAVVQRHALDEVGHPGERWDGDDPPTLERILFHLLQEYARHAGHLDIVAELAGGWVGE